MSKNWLASYLRTSGRWGHTTTGQRATSRGNNYEKECACKNDERDGSLIYQTTLILHYQIVTNKFTQVIFARLLSQLLLIWETLFKTNQTKTMEQKYTEILISSEIDNIVFEKIGNRIIKEFKAEIISKLCDLNSTYYDFKINSNLITLHKQVFVGISIFPTDLNNASIECNGIVKKIGYDLKSFVKWKIEQTTKWT